MSVVRFNFQVIPLEKEESRAVRELISKYGLNLAQLKELGEFLHSVQEFVQYLGTNQYYSDTVNKKIFLLSLDVDTALLRLGHLNLRASGFKSRLLLQFLSKKKADFPASELDAYRNDFDLLVKEVDVLQTRALTLTDDIREEYKKKERF